MTADINESDQLASDLPKQYELLGKIRVGGMGAIYKAQNRFTKQFCAIKVLRPDVADDPLTRQRFTVEAKAASSLKHPNICQVFDFGETQGDALYLVMEWIDGISLEDRVSVSGPLSEAEAIPIFLQVCSALSFAHTNHVVHRDLKPDNIMVTTDPKTGHYQVRLVDFGIAKVVKPDPGLPAVDGLTQTGTIVGTPSYMSPEQARAKQVDGRSDIYSFGCVMYFALSGAPPFLGDSFMDVLYKHVNVNAPPLDAKLKVSPALNVIMLKSLEKKIEDRYQSIEELATDLKKLSKGVKIGRKVLAKDRQQQRQNIIRVACFLLAFGLMYAFGIWMDKLAHPAPGATGAKGAAAGSDGASASKAADGHKTSATRRKKTKP